MEEYQAFHKAIKDPGSLGSAINAAGKKIIGYMCSYGPEEIIHAAGFHPMRLFPSKSEIMLAENHLQTYCCSLVRGILEDSLAGRLDFLAGTVFPHTCDSIQRLSDIWRLNGRHGFFADVVMPVKLNSQSARDYMKAVLKTFKKDLETAAGKTISNDDLSKSISTFNVIRKNLSRIYSLQSKRPGLIKGSDLHALIKGSMLMNRDELAAILPTITGNLEKMIVPDTRAKRVVLSGSVCDLPDMYSMIEEAGGVVVADDLCTGQRWFEGELSETIDPLESITSRYMDRIVCPAKHKGITARGEYLANLIRDHHADGVIFTLLKFCDPHGFDYPYLKEVMAKEGRKSMLLEMDGQQQRSGQLSTRIETFIHMI